MVSLLSICLALAPLTAWVSQDVEEDGVWFTQQIAPLLESRCLKCHGGGEKIKGGLLLTSRSSLLEGGQSGVAVNLESPEDSLLLQMVRWTDEHHQMPPDGRLPSDQLSLIEEWVGRGVPWGDVDLAPIREREAETEGGGSVGGWSYRPVKRPLVPAVTALGWVKNPIDAFILHRLEEAQLAPNPPASPDRLVRRVTYGVTGLPPTPESVDAFVAEPSDEAWEELVERLLASPHYGETWGRHWLDVVRYAETHGFERDADKPEIWRYRDWVIDAFNTDMPYDRFVRDQLAGDEIGEVTQDSLVATGYSRLMQWDDEPGGGAVQGKYDTLSDLVDTTGEAFMGMTLGCARCHDHKGDPIPQKDYYRFMALFHGVSEVTKEGNLLDWPVPGAVADEEGNLPTIKLNVVSEKGPTPEPMAVFIRGNPHLPGEVVEPGYPESLDPAPFAAADLGEAPSSSGRRRALAEWLISTDHPRTARVMVNRIWQHHFGRGIVATSNDFGVFGSGPTHPDLLDWLAAEFMDQGWSVKAMHRLILECNTYRMASTGQTAGIEADPENRLFWRVQMRRLRAEEMRDAMLVMTGQLNTEMGGPSFFSFMPESVLATSSKPHEVWGKSSQEQRNRRSVYIKVKRSLATPLLAIFDMADTDESCPERFTTTLPTQALTMLNGESVRSYAEAFARHLEETSGPDPKRCVKNGLRLALGRQVTETEVSEYAAFIASVQREESLSAQEALSDFCLLVLNLNEFAYLD